MRRTRWLLVGLASLVAGCSGLVLRDRVTDARAALATRPGAKEAVDYAQALLAALEGDAYADDLAAFQRYATDALAALAGSEQAAGNDRPLVVGYRGLLLLDLRRDDEAWAELQRSMAMRPTLVAARGLLPMWGRLGRADEVARVCTRTIAAVTEPGRRFRLIEICVKNMHAADEATALAWASPEVRRFYANERARRQAEADAERRLSEQQQDEFMENMRRDNQLATDQAQMAAQMAAQAAAQ